jgi:hypothetical protein
MAACLARLGRFREATALAQTTLRTNPDDPELLFGASLIYCLTGDRRSALSHAKAALAKGKSPHWFTGSAFRPLLQSGELQPLLTSSGLGSRIAEDRSRGARR